MDPDLFSSRQNAIEAADPWCDEYFNEVVSSIGSLPKQFDWRDKNRVSAVKDQGQCSTCWAFAITGLIEGQLMGEGSPISLSEQQLIDCVPDTKGCCAGYSPNKALNHVIQAGGIQADSTYPYQFRQDDCTFNSSKVVAKVEKFCEYEWKGAESTKALIVNYGPVVAYMNVSNEFHNQKVDSIYDLTCKTQEVNHAVLIVGYGTSETTNQDYWIVVSLVYWSFACRKYYVHCINQSSPTM
jgi:C1A family cysteine protease